jgi:hypothetical protein
MRHVVVAGAVAAAALLMAGAVPRAADALPVANAKLQVSPESGLILVKRGGGGGGGHGGGHHGFGRGGGGLGGHIGKHYGGGGGIGKHYGGGGGRHHHRGGGIRVSPRYYGYGYAPYYYGYYDSYYSDECAWLRRKARLTDSSYWWRRYERCRDLYD